jgi:hypothetical protein
MGVERRHNGICMSVVEETWEKRRWWRYDDCYHVPNPDAEDNLELVR